MSEVQGTSSQQQSQNVRVLKISRRGLQAFEDSQYRDALKSVKEIERTGRATQEDIDKLEGLLRDSDGFLTERAQKVLRRVALALERGAEGGGALDCNGAVYKRDGTSRGYQGRQMNNIY